MKKIIFLVFSIIILLFIQNIQCRGCFSQNLITKRCLQCSQDMRLFKGNCLYNIQNCIQYFQGNDCQVCEYGYKLIKIEDRIQCTKLQKRENQQFSEEEMQTKIDTINQQNDQKLQFYQFLNDFFEKKQLQNNLHKRLLKILDRNYFNGKHYVLMFYKTQKAVMKGIISVIGQYKSFELIQFKEAKDQQISQQQVVYFWRDQGSNFQEQRAKIRLNQKQTMIITDDSSDEVLNQDQIKETSDFNFQYQKPQTRQNDIGFKTSDEFLKLANSKILQQQTKVIGCFVKNSGLRKNYRIIYKTPQQQIYEGEVIYDVVRRRAYILNFGKQFSV